MKIITPTTSSFRSYYFTKFKSSLFLLALLLVSSISFGQAASATWIGTTDATAANSGNVTGANQVFGTANTSFGFSGTNGFQSIGWPTTAYSSSQTTNYQFAINPTTGNNLSVTSVSLQPSISGPGSATWAVYYSTSPSFTSPVQIGTNTTVNSTTPTTTTFSSLSIPVNSGNTIYLRFVAGSADASGRNIRVRNFVISGTTAAAAPTYTSTVSGGDWNTAATWSLSTGGTGVPTAGSIVVVNTNVTAAATPTNQPSSITVNSGFTLTLNGTYTNPGGSTVTVNSGGTLAVGASYTNTGSTAVNGTFQINQGGFGGGAGTWTYGAASTLVFNHTSGTYGPIDAAHTYWPAASSPVNVTVNNNFTAPNGINLGVSRTVTGIFQTAGNIQGNALTLNGTARINTGGSFTSTPIYGSASTLIYNTGATFGRGNEWTTATSGAGYPANVQISNPGTVTTVNMGTSTAQCSGNITVDAATVLNTTSGGLTVLGSVTTNGTTNTGGALNVTGTVTTNGTITLGGDVTLTGTTSSNWVVGATATQTNNSKAVFFTGATGTQLITKTAGGTVFFDYLVINKAAGSVQFSTGTDVTINTTTGDVVQLLNAGALDLNGRTLTLTGVGGNISANAANRSITSGVTGAALAITGAKSFSGAGTLIINTNVTALLSAGFDFGVSKVTVNGTLQLNFGGFASNGSAPTYASASTLLFNTGGFYDVHNGSADVAGWFRNVASTGTAQAGVPWNVTISGNTSVRYNTANTDNFPRYINGNLVITSGSALTLGGLSTTAGDFFLRGNWTNSGTFNPNSRLVSFNGTTAQTLTGATAFDYLTLDNTTGLSLAASVTVNQTLSLTAGKITLGSNTLTVGPAGTITGANTTNYIVTASTGQLKRTVGGTATLFAVGNTAYNPITFTNSGTSDVYGVRVVNTAPAGANNTKTVTRQWITTEAVAGGSTLAVVAQYNTGETGLGFAAATDAFIGHYNGTVYTGQIAATITGSNPFVTTSNPTLTLSPPDLTTGTQYFAIGKDNGLLSVPSRYVITTITPSSPTAGIAFSATVAAQDNYGGTTTLPSGSNFTLTSNGAAGTISGTTSGAIASGTSSIVVSGIVLPSAGTGVTLTATNSSGLSLTAGTSSSFAVLAAADRLAFVAVPATGNVSVNLASFTVEARRPDNSLDNTYTGNITIAKATGTGTLTGTLTVAAVAGVATFSAAQFDTADTYTLSATSGTLTAATSGSIVITLAPISLGTYAFTGTASSSGPAARLLASSVASNVSFSSYGRNTLTINAASGADDNVFSVQPSAGTYGTVINTALYEEFTVTPAVGYYLNLGSLTFSIGRTGAGASNYIVRSNQDNYTADISTGTIPTTAATRTVTLSGTSNNAVTYRIYLYGGGSTGFTRIDDVTFNGNAICIQPTAYAVTGGGAYCSGGTGASVGLANSQVGVSYQLKNGASNVGSLVAGTGSAISFGLQTAVGTYTVVGSNTNGTCNLTQTMTGSVAVSINPLPTAAISGTTTVCQNSISPSITFTGANGTAPYTFTYSLNGGSNQTITTSVGNSVTLSVPTSSTGTFTYALVSVAGQFCSQNQSGSAVVTVTPSTTSAVISGNAAVCSGTSTNISVAITDGISPYSVVYTDGTSNFTVNGYTSGSAIAVSPITTTSYTLVSVTSTGGCAGIGNTGTATVTLNSTSSSDGISWTNGPPSGTIDAILTGVGTIALGANLNACSLTVNGPTVSVTSGFNVDLNGALTVTSGSLTLNNNSNLIQHNSGYTNTGNIIVKRNSAAINRLDYTLWSSPVAGQGLYAFSKFTLPNRFYVYDSTNDVYSNSVGFSLANLQYPSPLVIPNGVDGNDLAGITFATAKGYLIRTPYNHPTAPTAFEGTFTGIPNSGDVTVTGLTSGSYYATGNPYPSTINANQFISDNSVGNNPLTPGHGLYFWRKTNNSATSSYATYTTAGGVKSGGDTLNIVPNGIIQVGEGFIVKTTSTSLSFNNGQRVANNANQFLRTENLERHRIWLNLSDATSNVNQMMVAYMTGATQDIDAGIDGRFFNDSPTALNSLVNNEEFAVQGRSLPFDASDIVPLAFKAAAAGNYSISIDHVDGLFTDGSQSIYLRDILTNTEYNLNSGAYNFASDAGAFTNRFEVVYQSQLGVGTPNFTANTVVIYNQNTDFVVNSGTVIMASIKVFDIRGRLIQEKTGINASQAIIGGGQSNQVLLVQITSEDGIVVTKKVIR